MSNKWSIKIENGVPIPPRFLGHSLAKIIYGMKPGQSFVMSSARAEYAYTVAKQIGVHVVTRKLNGSGVRVWRVTAEQKRNMNRAILKEMAKACEQ